MAYQAISEILQRHDSDLEASTAHGIASAMLCVDQNAQIDDWLDEILADAEDLLEEDKHTLVELFELTRKFLQPETPHFDFDLLLPPEEDLQQDVIALIQWCEGFLWGIGYTHSSANWSGDIQGILRDMVEFTKLDTDILGENGESNNEDEESFMQIHQYLRAAVLIIRDELQTATPAQTH